MNKKYRALVVDDERLARKDLTAMLGEFSNIQEIREAENVDSAVEVIEKFKPDIVFLDIQMPGETGFDLLEKTDLKAKIIFVTAYDEYAIRAFEVNALDYLLKPVNPERLARALDRLELDETVENLPVRKLNYHDRLFLSINNHLKFLKVDHILCINSAGDYSELVLTNCEKGLTQKSLREWEHRLPSNYFCRIHRSTIINMEYILKLEEWFNYSFRIYLKGIETPMVISRRYAALLKHKFA